MGDEQAGPASPPGSKSRASAMLRWQPLRRVSNVAALVVGAVLLLPFPSLVQAQATCSKVWTNAIGDNLWQTSDNWNPSGVPGLADDACIGTGFPTVTLSAGNHSINSVTASSPLSISGATLTIAAASSINSTFSLAGTLTVSSTASLAFTGVNDKVLNGGTLNNAGTTTWTDTGNLILQDGAVFNNLGAFSAQNDQTILLNTFRPPGNFNNLAGGTFTKSASFGTTTFSSLPFTNSGTVVIQTGTLNLTAGGSTTGGTFTGPGLTRLTNGTLTVAGTNLADGSFELAAGTLAGAADGSATLDCTLTATLPCWNWTGGVMVGTFSVRPTGTLALSGPNGKTMSAAMLNNAGTTTWADTGNLILQDGAVFNNSGAFSAQNDQTILLNTFRPPGNFNNLAGGTFTKSASFGTTTFSSLPFTNSGTVVIQTGTLNLTAGGSTTGGTFTGPGLTRQTGGTLTVIGTNLADGSFELAAGMLAGADDGSATLDCTLPASPGLSSKTHRLGTSRPPGADRVLPPIRRAVDASLPCWNWTGGVMVGTLSIRPTGTLALSGPNGHLMSAATLNNAGTTTWTDTGNLFVNNGSIVNNSGAFNAQNNQTFFWTGGGQPAFNNLAGGTFTKSASTGTTNVSNMPFTTAGTVEALSGTLAFATSYMQTAGTTRLDGGNLAGPATINIQAGTLTGTGTISANVNNAAQLNPGGPTAPFGVLTITGTYTQTATGTLNVRVGGSMTCTAFDQVSISGAAMLAGTLSIAETDGCLPSSGQSFQIMTFATHDGDFASTTTGWNRSFTPTILNIVRQ